MSEMKNFIVCKKHEVMIYNIEFKKSVKERMTV